MKSTTIMSFISLFFITSLGCGRAYQSITADNLSAPLNRYDGQRVSISGIPAAPQHHDFLPPTPWRAGQWTLVVNGVRCIETLNFENEPRIRSMLQMAASARKKKQPVAVSGKMVGGQLEMESFEGIHTDTSWYKNKNPYYSYGDYYEWYPFAYSPNSRALTAIGVR